ncbi:hypothetical protein F5144DRAFT_559088 [Chaetomium tenue]|uniref:Uncharacterized protein n=1 Tax=Chaetomium tenue TaxID=1854479 RepID=A0ACB7PTR5_9PEZI|nr:hypothetical protein F5144DRAFT_559088 [Chaetomium globosum]
MAVLARGCTRSLEPRGQLENSGADASCVPFGPHPPGSYIFLRSRTLEVVPAQDYSKLAFNKNDKVAFVPYHEHDKIAVPPQSYDDTAHYHQADSAHWGLQPTPTQDGYTWDGDAPDPWATGEGVGTEKKKRIIGLKRWVFFTVLGIAALLVAIGVGVGVGVGVSTRSTNNAEADAAASTTSMQISETATSSVQGSTASSASQASASRSSTSSAPQSTPSRQVGGIGGRCSENWGSDCICLDQTVCANTWNGTVQTGRKPDWPCPNDPVAVKACYVQPCKNAAQLSSRCLWREDCAELDPGDGNVTVCPGGKDFICCAKLLTG